MLKHVIIDHLAFQLLATDRISFTGSYSHVSQECFDFDGDGYLDFYAASYGTLEDGEVATRDYLFYNAADGTFADFTDFLVSIDGTPEHPLRFETNAVVVWAVLLLVLGVGSSLISARRVLAIELMTACRALDLRAPLAPAAGTGAARASVRTVVAGPGPDRIVSDEIRAVEELVRSGALLDAVRAGVGPLA